MNKVTNKPHKGPKILFLDIETAPIEAFVWGLWDQNVGLNQIKRDWFMLSWSAKWLHEDKIMYADQRGKKNLRDDKPLCRSIWKLIDEADIVVGHNSRKFDIRKLNSRFIKNGMAAPSNFRQIDTLEIAKKRFGFTSNKLEHLADILCVKYKKYVNRKFPGFVLWDECLKNNMQAWHDMELYNKNDVLALQEVYEALIPWDASIDFQVYTDSLEAVCSKCNGTKFMKRGFDYSNAGKYQRYRCKRCKADTRSKENLLSKDKRKSLRPGTRG